MIWAMIGIAVGSVGGSARSPPSFVVGWFLRFGRFHGVPLLFRRLLLLLPFRSLLLRARFSFQYLDG